MTRASGWINIQDQLPEAGVNVLVHPNQGRPGAIAWLSGTYGDRWYDHSGSWLTPPYTHWMPLPDAPEED